MQVLKHQLGTQVPVEAEVIAEEDHGHGNGRNSNDNPNSKSQQHVSGMANGPPASLIDDFPERISEKKVFLLLGATAALIEPKDLPIIARTVGRFAGRSIDTVAQLEAIRHEIRTIYFMNPGPLTSRLVDNVNTTAGDNMTANGPKKSDEESTIVENGPKKSDEEITIVENRPQKSDK
ncbi:hypothetical protein H5410_004501 [Solanum commersonii]|uniref:Uncharacterized protein n=1 Tax=Solanum commersonii TaxID=4109 RepID=A0A9J6B7V0_SOLCO|nr:hypothetical protein H5410_004501 [Solanum commersonii]